MIMILVEKMGNFLLFSASHSSFTFFVISQVTALTKIYLFYSCFDVCPLFYSFIANGEKGWFLFFIFSFHFFFLVKVRIFGEKCGSSI